MLKRQNKTSTKIISLILIQSFFFTGLIYPESVNNKDMAGIYRQEEKLRVPLKFSGKEFQAEAEEAMGQGSRRRLGPGEKEVAIVMQAIEQAILQDRSAYVGKHNSTLTAQELQGECDKAIEDVKRRVLYLLPEDVEVEIRRHDSLPLFSGEPSHGFMVLSLGKRHFLIDPTFIQLFEPIRGFEDMAQEPGVMGYAKHIIKSNSQQTGNNWDIIASKLILKGYIELSDDVAAMYGVAFYTPIGLRVEDFLNESTKEDMHSGKELEELFGSVSDNIETPAVEIRNLLGAALNKIDLVDKTTATHLLAELFSDSAVAKKNFILKNPSDLTELGMNEIEIPAAVRRTIEDEIGLLNTAAKSGSNVKDRRFFYKRLRVLIGLSDGENSDIDIIIARILIELASGSFGEARKILLKNSRDNAEKITRIKRVIDDYERVYAKLHEILQGGYVAPLPVSFSPASIMRTTEILYDLLREKEASPSIRGDGLEEYLFRKLDSHGVAGGEEGAGKGDAFIREHLKDNIEGIRNLSLEGLFIEYELRKRLEEISKAKSRIRIKRLADEINGILKGSAEDISYREAGRKVLDGNLVLKKAIDELMESGQGIDQVSLQSDEYRNLLNKVHKASIVAQEAFLAGIISAPVRSKTDLASMAQRAGRIIIFLPDPSQELILITKDIKKAIRDRGIDPSRDNISRLGYGTLLVWKDFKIAGGEIRRDFAERRPPRQKKVSRRDMLRFLVSIGAVAAGGGIAYKLGEAPKSVKEERAYLAQPLHNDFYDTMSRFSAQVRYLEASRNTRKNLLSSEDTARIENFLAPSRVEAIRFAAKEYGLEPELIAGFIYEEKIYQDCENSIKKSIKEFLSGAGGMLDMKNTCGIGNTSAIYMLENRGFLDTVYENREFFLSLLRDKKAISALDEFINAYKEIIEIGHEPSWKAHIQYAPGVFIGLVENVESAGILYAAYIMRKSANEIRERTMGETKIPDTSIMTEHSRHWTLKDRKKDYKPIPDVYDERYKNAFNQSYYPPYCYQYFLAADYTGVIKSSIGQARARGKVKAYLIFLRSSIFKAYEEQRAPIEKKIDKKPLQLASKSDQPRGSWTMRAKRAGHLAAMGLVALTAAKGSSDLAAQTPTSAVPDTSKTRIITSTIVSKAPLSSLSQDYVRKSIKTIDDYSLEVIEVYDVKDVVDTLPPSMNQDGYAIYRFGKGPVYLLDFISESAQAEALDRIAYFAEKEGYRGKVLTDEEMDTVRRSVYNGHDYNIQTLASFFTKAEEDKVRLNDVEIRLKDRLIREKLLAYEEAKRYVPRGNYALMSITHTVYREYPGLRKKVALHELSHAVYFTNPEYRRDVKEMFNKVTSHEQAIVRAFLKVKGYDIGNEDILLTEYAAYFQDGQTLADILGIEFMEVFGRHGKDVQLARRLIMGELYDIDPESFIYHSAAKASLKPQVKSFMQTQSGSLLSVLHRYVKGADIDEQIKFDSEIRYLPEIASDIEFHLPGFGILMCSGMNEETHIGPMSGSELMEFVRNANNGDLGDAAFKKAVIDKISEFGIGEMLRLIISTDAKGEHRVEIVKTIYPAEIRAAFGDSNWDLLSLDDENTRLYLERKVMLGNERYKAFAIAPDEFEGAFGGTRTREELLKDLSDRTLSKSFQVVWDIKNQKIIFVRKSGGMREADVLIQNIREKTGLLVTEEDLDILGITKKGNAGIEQFRGIIDHIRININDGYYYGNLHYLKSAIVQKLFGGQLGWNGEGDLLDFVIRKHVKKSLGGSDTLTKQRPMPTRVSATVKKGEPYPEAARIANGDLYVVEFAQASDIHLLYSAYKEVLERIKGASYGDKDIREIEGWSRILRPCITRLFYNKGIKIENATLELNMAINRLKIVLKAPRHTPHDILQLANKIRHNKFVKRLLESKYETILEVASNGKSVRYQRDQLSFFDNGTRTKGVDIALLLKLPVSSKDRAAAGEAVYVSEDFRNELLGTFFEDGEILMCQFEDKDDLPKFLLSVKDRGKRKVLRPDEFKDTRRELSEKLESLGRKLKKARQFAFKHLPAFIEEDNVIDQIWFVIKSEGSLEEGSPCFDYKGTRLAAANFGNIPVLPFRFLEGDIEGFEDERASEYLFRLKLLHNMNAIYEGYYTDSSAQETHDKSRRIEKQIAGTAVLNGRLDGEKYRDMDLVDMFDKAYRISHSTFPQEIRREEKNENGYILVQGNNARFNIKFSINLKKKESIGAKETYYLNIGTREIILKVEPQGHEFDIRGYEVLDGVEQELDPAIAGRLTGLLFVIYAPHGEIGLAKYPLIQGRSEAFLMNQRFSAEARCSFDFENSPGGAQDVFVAIDIFEDGRLLNSEPILTMLSFREGEAPVVKRYHPSILGDTKRMERAYTALINVAYALSILEQDEFLPRRGDSLETIASRRLSHFFPKKDCASAGRAEILSGPDSPSAPGIGTEVVLDELPIWNNTIMDKIKEIRPGTGRPHALIGRLKNILMVFILGRVDILFPEHSERGERLVNDIKGIIYGIDELYEEDFNKLFGETNEICLAHDGSGNHTLEELLASDTYGKEDIYELLNSKVACFDRNFIKNTPYEDILNNFRDTYKILKTMQGLAERGRHIKALMGRYSQFWKEEKRAILEEYKHQQAKLELLAKAGLLAFIEHTMNNQFAAISGELTMYELGESVDAEALQKGMDTFKDIISGVRGMKVGFSGYKELEDFLGDFVKQKDIGGLIAEGAAGIDFKALSLEAVQEITQPRVKNLEELRAKLEKYLNPIIAEIKSDIDIRGKLDINPDLRRKN